MAAGGAVVLPGWLGPRPAATPAGLEQQADEAEQLWRRSIGIVAAARGVPPDEALIGGEWTPLVTTLGEAEAKRVSMSPAWPRALVREFHRAGLGPGDVVAASFSGSFPGINLAVMSAAEAMRLRLLAVSSVTASSWGATDPGFTWPEIEARLVAAGVLRRVTVAVSAGGDGDRALDLDDEGRSLAREIAARCAGQLRARLLVPVDFESAIRDRLDAYRRSARRTAHRRLRQRGGHGSGARPLARHPQGAERLARKGAVRLVARPWPGGAHGRARRPGAAHPQRARARRAMGNPVS